MILPTSFFEHERGDGPDSEAARDAALLEQHGANGYLKARTEPAPPQVALYVDRERGRDVIGLVRNAGIGDMCNLTQFQVWSDPRNEWLMVDVLPMDDIAAKVTALRGNDVGWWPERPVRGTDTPIVDEAHRTLLALRWTGGRFVIAP